MLHIVYCWCCRGVFVLVIRIYFGVVATWTGGQKFIAQVQSFWINRFCHAKPYFLTSKYGCFKKKKKTRKKYTYYIHGSYIRIHVYVVDLCTTRSISFLPPDCDFGCTQVLTVYLYSCRCKKFNFINYSFKLGLPNHCNFTWPVLTMWWQPTLGSPGSAPGRLRVVHRNKRVTCERRKQHGRSTCQEET